MLPGNGRSPSGSAVVHDKRHQGAAGCLSRCTFLATTAGLITAATLTRPSSAQSQAPPLGPPVPVKVGVTPVTSAAAVYLALDRGYFGEEGLDVTLEPFDSGVQMIPLLGTGQLDVGSGAVNAGLFNAVLRGIPPVLIEPAAQSDRQIGMLLPVGGGETTPAVEGSFRPRSKSFPGGPRLPRGAPPAALPGRRRCGSGASDPCRKVRLARRCTGPRRCSSR